MGAGERLRLLFCDNLNLARGKYLPASKIGDGRSRFCQGTFALSYDKELLAAPGSKMAEGLPDMDAVYKAADIREGWEPNTKVVVGDLEENGAARPWRRHLRAGGRQQFLVVAEREGALAEA